MSLPSKWGMLSFQLSFCKSSSFCAFLPKRPGDHVPGGPQMSALPAPLPQARDIEAEGSDTRTGLIINFKSSYDSRSNRQLWTKSFVHNCRWESIALNKMDNSFDYLLCFAANAVDATTFGFLSAFSHVLGVDRLLQDRPMQEHHLFHIYLVYKTQK